MIQIELKSFLDNFITKYKNTLLKHELYGVDDFDSLLNDLIVFREGLKAVEDTFITLKEHIIDKFYLGEVVLKFYNNNYSYSQIAEILSVQSGTIIDKYQVKEWVENYSHLERPKQVEGYGNLFDIQERMQDIYTQLQDHLIDIRASEKEEFFKAKTTKQQVVLETYKEIRALTKDAANIIQALSHQQQLQEFRKVIIESIKEVSPSMAQAVIRKLKENKALYSALLPGS